MTSNLSLTQGQLIDKALHQLYDKEPPFAPKSEGTLLLLNFALTPNTVFIDAYRVIDRNLITVYTTDTNLSLINTPIDQLCQSLIVVEESGKVLVDITQWFCSCREFCDRFEELSVHITTEDLTDLYGHRNQPKEIQFDLSNGKEIPVPICKHLLAVYLIKLYPQKFSECLRLQQVTQSDYLKLFILLN